MRFPKRFGILFARIALERFMSPELAKETLDEINNAIRELTEWWKRKPDSPKSGEPTPDMAFGDSPDALISDPMLASTIGELPEENLDAAKAYAERVIEAVIARNESEHLSGKELVGILEDNLPDSANYYVVWVAEGVIDDNPGRYVHLSWNRDNGQVNYVVRDFLSGLMFSPTHRPRRDAGWEHRYLKLTAGAIWDASPRRFPIVGRTGLSGIGGVIQNADHWQTVLDIMTKLMPPKTLVDDAGPST